MAGFDQAFQAHLDSGLTSLCRCWAVTRSDGITYGFTDHDVTRRFEDIDFRADTGLTAQALQQSTGLSVDNSEAIGALSDAAIREEDIEDGWFDGAEIRAWLVKWADTDMRWLQFRGALGELRRAGGAFHADMRGLTEALNRPLGRIYQGPCTAVLGDKACAFALDTPGYSEERAIEHVERGQTFHWPGMAGFDPGWFARGRFEVLSGNAKGLWGMIKQDRFDHDYRVIELWDPIGGSPQVGDMVRLTAGCDKRVESCRLKFNNLVNFQGFPDIPGEDWMMAVPKKNGRNSGGSLR